MPLFKSRSSLSDKTYQKLKDAISGGKLSPGEYLPTEGQLCRLLSVSRRTVRSALKRLASEGKLNATHGHGWKLEGSRLRHPVVLVEPVSLETHPEFAETLAASLAEKNFGLLVQHVAIDSMRKASLSRHVLLDHVGGIVHFSGIGLPPEDVAKLEEMNIPAVGVSLSQVAPYDSISIDNVMGTRMIMEHLLSTGHSRILFLNCLLNDPSFKIRLEAFKDLVAKEGLPCLTYDLPLNCIVPKDASIISAIIRKRKVDAVLTVTDVIARYVIMSQRMEGIMMPEDVSVAAYGNFVPEIEFAHFGIKRLTGVKYPLAEMARQAADAIVRRIDGDDSPPRLTLMAPDYDRGDSVKNRNVRKTSKKLEGISI